MWNSSWVNFIGSIAFLQKLEICKVGYFYNLTNSKFSKISITQENAIALSKFLIFSGALPRECALNGLDFYEGENFQKLKNSLILLIFKICPSNKNFGILWWRLGKCKRHWFYTISLMINFISLNISGHFHIQSWHENDLLKVTTPSFSVFRYAEIDIDVITMVQQ